MHLRRKFFHTLWAMATVWLLFWHGGVVCSGDEPQSVPKFSEIEVTVRGYFKAVPGHFPGRIITQSQAAPLLELLYRGGWKKLNRGEILGRVMADDSFLVRQLRTAHGNRFMRKLGSYPTTYDQLDRLSRMPRGRNTVRTLINSVGTNQDVTRWLVTTDKGKRMSSLMGESYVPVKKFERPTGGIYTAEILLQEFRKYCRAAKKTPAAK